MPVKSGFQKVWRLGFILVVRGLTAMENCDMIPFVVWTTSDVSRGLVTDDGGGTPGVTH